MAKFVEIPRKPREVEAVQFTGIVNGVLTTSEQGYQSWFVAAFANGTLSVTDGELYLRDEVVPAGTFLLVELDDKAGSGMWQASTGHMAINWRPKRKTPVARKPRAVKTPVAKAAK